MGYISQKVALCSLWTKGGLMRYICIIQKINIYYMISHTLHIYIGGLMGYIYISQKVAHCSLWTIFSRCRGLNIIDVFF